MIRYLIVPQTFESPELGRYTGYGIGAYSIPDNTCLVFVEDVSCDEAFAADLADRCTEGQLDPAQLLDVILDAL